MDKMTMQFIKNISRNDEVFKGRSFKFGSFVNGEIVIEEEIPIPDSDILCDWCNSQIQTEQIKVIINVDISTGKGNISHAICDDCKKNKFSDIIEIR